MELLRRDTGSGTTKRGCSKMSMIDSKIKEAFENYVVRKELIKSQEIGRLPRFISEYLIAKFSSGGEEGTVDMAKLSQFVNLHFPELRDRDKVLHDIMTTGSYTLIDEFKVETDIKAGRHRLIIPCLNIRDARVLATLLEGNPDLLRSGMWGIATLRYVPDETGGGADTGGTQQQQQRPSRGKRDETSPVIMTKFTPFEVVNVRLPDFTAKRASFTREEWVDLLIRSIGLNPQVYSPYQKMLLLCRLVPLVEPNCNFLEVGPKATGKTYLYRNISYSTRLISGGRVSPATLFYNITTKAVGEIAVRDCVVLDEIGKLTFSNSEEMIGKLKDYMVDGFFERGPKKAHAKASLVFMGNVELSGIPEAQDVVRSLPLFMQDSALLDRIHCFIPGWELPKIMQSSEHLATGYGIMADYLSEVFHQMSLQSYSHLVSPDRVKLSSTTIDGETPGSVTIRDEKAVRKVAAGLLKLLCPDGNCTHSDLESCLEMAAAGRERACSLLHSISPGEFPLKKIGYSIAS